MEIYDSARDEPQLRAFGLGYLAHLAADAVAHNYFVPRQLAVTSSTSSLGHSYWESRFETHLGTECRPARTRVDSDRPLALRRTARPRAEPDDLQHADKSSNLPRHGDRGRQRIAGSGSSSCCGRTAAGISPRTTSSRYLARVVRLHHRSADAHGPGGAVSARPVGRRGAAHGEARSPARAPRGGRGRGCTTRPSGSSDCRPRRWPSPRRSPLRSTSRRASPATDSRASGRRGRSISSSRIRPARLAAAARRRRKRAGLAGCSANTSSIQRDERRRRR